MSPLPQKKSSRIVKYLRKTSRGNRHCCSRIPLNHPNWKKKKKVNSRRREKSNKAGINLKIKKEKKNDRKNFLCRCTLSCVQQLPFHTVFDSSCPWIDRRENLRAYAPVSMLWHVSIAPSCKSYQSYLNTGLKQHALLKIWKCQSSSTRWK